MQAAYSYIELSACGSSECLMGDYCRELYEDYGLILYDTGDASGGINPEGVADEWYRYMNKFQMGPEGLKLYPYQVDDIQMITMDMASENDAKGFKQAIFNLEKYEELMDGAEQIKAALGGLSKQTESLKDFRAKLDQIKTSDPSAKNVEQTVTAMQLADGTKLLGLTQERGTLTKCTMGERSAEKISKQSHTELNDDTLKEMLESFLESNTSKAAMLYTYPQLAEISDNSFEITKAPSRLVSDSSRILGMLELDKLLEGNTNMIDIDACVQNYAFYRYVFRHFRSFEDVGCGKYTTLYHDQQIGPGYELEYILMNKRTDRLNMGEAIWRISCIRMSLNLSYLLGDSEKIEQAQSASEELLKYSDNPIAIETGTALILLTWAYMETICDLEELLDQGQVPLIKTLENWNTPIEQIPLQLFGNTANYGLEVLKYYLGLLKPDPNRTLPDTNKELVLNFENPDYEGYLFLTNFLFGGKNDAFYAMDLMQLHLRQKCPGLYMENMMCGFELEFTVSCKPVFISKLLGTNQLLEPYYKDKKFRDKRHY